MFKKLLFLFSFLPSVFIAQAQDDWKLKTDKDGIKIFSRNVADSRINTVKVVCDLSASLTQLIAVLLDIKTSDQWQYNTKNFTLIKQGSPADLYYYAEVSFPWPTSNRDFATHLTVTQDARSKTVTVDALNIPDLVPVKPNLVRIPKSTARWTIIQAQKNLLHIEYILQVDPGGTVPAWLINLVSFKGPFETFKSLRLQLKKPAYATVSLPFIID